MLDIDISYEIEIEDYFNEEKIKEFANHIVKSEKGNENFENHDYYISLLITDNDRIHEINKEYRGMDRPTDVISFAYNETESFEDELEVIGDIIISIDKIKEQAKDYGHTEIREFYYILSHGLLHILGYDHIVDEEKAIMREKEEKYLSAYQYNRE